jgi:ABC-2 type transport system permease protein
MRPVLIVAEKEFRDHITSKRFIIIFGIMILLAIYAISTGMDAYNTALDQYKNPQHSPDYIYKQQSIERYQQMILEAQASNQSPESIQMLQEQLESMQYTQMPSVLNVFQSMTMLIMLAGILLGAAMGFDQIAREKDEGSLKFLVSSPIYRDAIINGKTIGAIATLAGAMGAAFAFAIAIVMLKGVVPGMDDLIRIFLFFIAAMLYCTVFFALAIMMSALSKNTAMAAIFTVGMVFAVFIYTVMALLAANTIATSIVGPAPVIDYSYYSMVSVNESAGNITTYTPPYDYSASTDYYNRLSTVQAQVSNILSAFSPIDAFSGYLGFGHMGVGPAMLTRQNSYAYMYGPIPGVSTSGEEMSLLDSLDSVWMRVLIMIAEIIAAFGIAYVAFMRTDVR